MQTKMNKNGVKLLAAVMVFAMAFAGVAIVSDASDAATAPTDATPLVDFNSVVDGGVYKITTDMDIAGGTINGGKKVVIYGENKTINITEDLIISEGSDVTFIDCTFNLSAGKVIYVFNTGSKITLDGCTFSTGGSDYAVNIEAGTGNFTGTNFNNKKLTLNVITEQVNITSCSNLYLNIGMNVKLDSETDDTGILKIDSASTIQTIRIATGSTLDLNKNTISTSKLLIGAGATGLQNGTFTAKEISAYPTQTPDTFTVNKLTLTGTIESTVPLTVKSSGSLTINGSFDGDVNVGEGATFTNNNTLPGSNLIPATGNAKGEGWEYKSGTLTLNGYNGNNVFNGTISEIILIGDNVITVDADEDALVAITSNSLSKIKTQSSGTGSLTINITGEKAGTAIIADDTAGALEINGVSIEINIENTSETGSKFNAIQATRTVTNNFTTFTLTFATLEIVIDGSEVDAGGIYAKVFNATKSNVTIDVPGDGIYVETATTIAGSEIVISAGYNALTTGTVQATISNESVISVGSTLGYAYVGGFMLTQGSTIAASSMYINADSSSYSSVTNDGNMVIENGKTFINNANFVNNGIIGVYGTFKNAVGETVNNGEINTYGYNANEAVTSVTITDSATTPNRVTFSFDVPVALADGTYEIKLIDGTNVFVGILTYSAKKITINALGEDKKVTFSITFDDDGNVSKYSVIDTAEGFNASGKVDGNKTALERLKGLVKAEESQYVSISGGKLTNNGSITINTDLKYNATPADSHELISGGEISNNGAITFNQDVDTTSGKLNGNSIVIGQNVEISLKGDVDTSFIYAGEYTYTDDETNKDVTVTYDNEVKVSGNCNGVSFKTNNENEDAEDSASIQILGNAAGTNKSVTVTIVKGEAFANAAIFAKGVTLEILSGATFQAQTAIDVNDGVLAAQDGSIINIKGDDPETYGFGALSYVISFAKDGYTYYGNLAYALANATEGMTLTLNKSGNAEIKEDLTVGKGITLQFAKGASLNIGGTEKITIDMLEGASFIFTDGNSINFTADAIVSGTFTYDNNTVVLNKVLMTATSGLGMDAAGKTTPSDIKVIVKGELTSGTITAKSGKVLTEATFSASESDKTASKLIVSEGANVTESTTLLLKTGASAVIDGTLSFAQNAVIGAVVSGSGSIVLDDNKSVNFDGTIAQNIAIANKGATDAITLADMVANKENNVNSITVKSFPKAGNTAAYLDVTGEYYSGKISISGNASMSALTIDEKAVFEVPAGSTVTVLSDSAVNGLVKVAGKINMKVAGDATTISYATLKYEITYTDGDYTVYTIVSTAVANASAGDSFTLTKDLDVPGKLEVPSGVTIIVPKDYKIILSDGEYIIIGSGITTIGATGGIQGTVELADGAFIIEFNDSAIDNSEMKIVGTTTDSKIVNSQVTVLNQLYATIYAVKNTVVLGDYALNNTVTSLIIPEIDGYRFVKFVDPVNKTINDQKVGETDVIASMLASQVQVTFQKVDGITYYVDNVKQNTVGAPVYISYGAIITAVADYGYSGTPLVNGKAYITVDDTTKTVVGSGVSPTEPEPTPEPEKKDKGMGITDYLLIILVILAAILVVIVAIRMMRS